MRQIPPDVNKHCSPVERKMTIVVIIGESRRGRWFVVDQLSWSVWCLMHRACCLLISCTRKHPPLPLQTAVLALYLYRVCRDAIRHCTIRLIMAPKWPVISLLPQEIVSLFTLLFTVCKLWFYLWNSLFPLVLFKTQESQVHFVFFRVWNWELAFKTTKCIAWPPWGRGVTSLIPKLDTGVNPSDNQLCKPPIFWRNIVISSSSRSNY